MNIWHPPVTHDKVTSDRTQCCLLKCLCYNVTNAKQAQLALTLKVLVLGDGEEGGESDKDFLEREERSLLRE